LRANQAAATYRLATHCGASPLAAWRLFATT
jgi:hypothetical protein